MLGLLVNEMDNLKILIQKKDWKMLKEKYPPQILAENLSFAEAMLLSRELLENEDWDDDLQTFAINLIRSIKRLRNQEWNANWKYDAIKQQFFCKFAKIL